MLLNGAENAYRSGLFAALIVPTGNADKAASSAAAPCRSLAQGGCDLRLDGPDGGIIVGSVPVAGEQAVQVARTASRCQAATPAAPFPDEAPGRSLAGWTMIEVFDTTAARSALARRKLPCPDCGQALKPWGRARERTVRELGGALLTVVPDRARCTGCGVTHVVLDAGLLPRRAYAAGLGRGHRLIARDLDVPQGTVRGWIRRACRSAGQLRAAGVQAVVALDPDALPAQVRPSQLAYALDALGSAAMALGDRFGLQHASPWARVTVLTRGQLLNLSPDG
jgi:transposase-like protein